MIPKTTFYMVTVVLVVFARAATAELIGIEDLSIVGNGDLPQDGFHVTRDTDTGLDWLDVTLSVNRSFNDVSDEFGAGSDYEGFRFATGPEVITLFDHARLILNDEGPDVSQPILDFISLVGSAPFGEGVVSGGRYDDTVDGVDPDLVGSARVSDVLVGPVDTLVFVRIVPDNDQGPSGPLGDPDAREPFVGALLVRPIPEPTRLMAGDADQDFKFDQRDLVRVQQAAKYLTGQPATWGDGDWDGAPGGRPGSPPDGNGVFDQVDLIAALTPAHYLTGPYAAINSNGQPGDGQASVGYNASTGELWVDAPAGTELTSINIDSATNIFTGSAAQNLNGSFDNDADNNIFKATFGSSFGSLSFGNVAQAGLSEEFVLGDLSVVGSLAGGGDLGDVDLIYVPEPSTIGMLLFGMLLGLRRFRRMD